MVSEIRFPEVPKIPVTSDFQPYLESTKKLSKIDKILATVFDFTESEHYKASSFLAKVVSTIFSVKKNVIPVNAPKEMINAAKEASNIAGAVGEALSFISGAGAIASLIQNIKKNPVIKADRQIRRWEITRSFLSIITSMTAFLNLLDRFKAIELGAITKAMGTIPVIGQGLARAFPASVVFSGFSIMTSCATITISALKLKQSVARMEKATQKIKNRWKNPVDCDLAKQKIDRIVTKQKDAVKKANELKATIEKMEPSMQAKGQEYEVKKAAYEKIKAEMATASKVSKFMRTFKEKNAMKAAKLEYKKEVKNYKKVSLEANTLEKAHKVRVEKGEKWEAIHKKFVEGTLTEGDKELLEKMRIEKVAKWKSKKVNEIFAIAKEVTKIALTLISIAIAITMIALVIIFSGNAPAAAMIAIAVIGLTLAATQLISKLYFNRIKKRPAKSVAIPDFRTLKAGT